MQLHCLFKKKENI